MNQRELYIILKDILHWHGQRVTFLMLFMTIMNPLVKTDNFKFIPFKRHKTLVLH